MKIFCQNTCQIKNNAYLCTRNQNNNGAIAQLVEQRTENPCVPGSIPGGTTYEELLIKSDSFFCFHFIHYLCNVFSKNNALKSKKQQNDALILSFKWLWQSLALSGIDEESEKRRLMK